MPRRDPCVRKCNAVLSASDCAASLKFPVGHSRGVEPPASEAGRHRTPRSTGGQLGEGEGPRSAVQACSFSRVDGIGITAPQADGHRLAQQRAE